MTSFVRRAALAALFVAAPCSTAVRAQSPAPARSLVVLIAIDQFRPDYLDRFGAQFTGGLARMRSQSALFTHGWQDHAVTETAPGHASFLSGREPVHTEIITNIRGVPDPTSPLLLSAGPGASPRRFMGTTLYDWMLARDSSVRALSVSRKDRGAILPVGRAAADVYWYADGRFTTSTYYRDTLPSWVSDYSRTIPFSRLAGTKWDLLRPSADYAEPDSLPVEHDGADFFFPHVLPSADALRTRIIEYPVMDSLTLDFALAGVRALGLGRRVTLAGSASRAEEPATLPDLLCVSLSTTDQIGHGFGPQSRELHDHLLRLDRWLGQFFDALSREVPAERTIVVMTSDHGVAPFPELQVQNGVRGGRLWLGDIAHSAGEALKSRYQTDFGFDFDNGLLLADVALLRAHRVNVDSLADALAAASRERVGVAKAYTPRTLAAAPKTDIGAERWRRTIPASIGWLLAAVASPNYIWSPGRSIAEHGTPHPENVTVPIAFIGQGMPIGRYESVVRTVDIGPTLAAILGVTPTEALDGHAIPEIVSTQRWTERRR